MPEQQLTSASNVIGNHNNAGNSMVIDPYTSAINRDIESDMVKSHENMFTAFAIPNHQIKLRQSEQTSSAIVNSNISNNN